MICAEVKSHTLTWFIFECRKLVSEALGICLMGDRGGTGTGGPETLGGLLQPSWFYDYLHVLKNTALVTTWTWSIKVSNAEQLIFPEILCLTNLILMSNPIRTDILPSSKFLHFITQASYICIFPSITTSRFYFSPVRNVLFFFFFHNQTDHSILSALMMKRHFSEPVTMLNPL